MSDARPPEPRRGDLVRASMFPGAGLPRKFGAWLAGVVDIYYPDGGN